MTRFLCRLAATVVAASAPLVVTVITTPAVSSAGCDPRWTRNVWTGECHPQPALPDWYAIRPAYAPPYAPPDVPPPPPPPPWAQELHPIWDEGSMQWVWVRI